MKNLFKYVGIRHLLAKPVRSILTALGVAFGVALFVGIDVINRSTVDSFKESVDAVAGKATLTLSAGEAGFPEEVAERVAKVPGVKHAVPMVESRAYFADNPNSSETLIVLGVDMLREQSVRTYKMSDEQVIDDPLVFLNQPDSIILTHAFAREHGLKIDSKFELATAKGKQTFTVRGLLSPEGPAKAFGGAIALMDIDGARMTFGKDSKLDRVDLVTKPGEDVETVAARIRETLGPGYAVEQPETQSENMRRMVASYQKMLVFFSTVALLVGVFLVSNSVGIAVAERRREIGTLRALGATRSGILWIFLAEAAAMGAAGAALGVGMGRALASMLVDLVARSMSGQYVTKIEINRIHFGWEDVARAMVIGTGAAFLAALWPALKSTRIEPLEAMKQRDVGEDAARRGFFRYSTPIGLGLLALLGVGSYLNLDSRYPAIEILSQLFSILGAALAGPGLVSMLVRANRGFSLACARIFARRGSAGPVIRLAQDNLLRNPRRTGSNVMSLMVGLVLVVMIAIVNMSFRTTIIDWFDRILRADVLVASTGKIISYQTQPLHEDLGREIEKIPGVKMGPERGAYAVRFVHVRYEGAQLGIKAFDEPDPALGYSIFDTLDRPREDAGRDLFHYEPGELPPILVSENFVLHYGKRTGETLELDTPSGRQAFRVIGVVSDYASPEGIFYLDRKVYRRLWQDPLINVFGLQAAPGTTAEGLRREVDRRFGRSHNLMATLNGEIKAQLLQAVDQGFAYTRAVEAAALLVGLLGLLNTLLISVMERTRELGMLRAVGMSARQMFSMVLIESVVQGGFGALVAVGCGTWISYLYVKNSLAHALGWIVAFHFPWEAIATTVFVGGAVALAAGIYPSARAARIQIREALEYE